jgi:uncharacterized protein YndB with AHSA1/START domain
MPNIRHMLHIAATRERVYEAITSVSGLSNWWTVETTGDASLGGVIKFCFNGAACTQMKVKELKPNEEVVWDCVSGFDDWVGTTLTFKLDESGGKTRLRFGHDNWRDENDFMAGCSFSWGRYMESIRQLCETGKGKAFGSDNY